MKIDYYKEFNLNVEHQLRNLNAKKPIQVGYNVNNTLCFAILVPRFLLPIRVSI